MLIDAVIVGAPAPGEFTALQPLRRRLGVASSSFGAGLDTDVAAEFAGVLRSISAAGVELVEVDLRDLLRTAAAAALPIALFEAAQLWRLACRGMKTTPERLIGG